MAKSKPPSPPDRPTRAQAEANLIQAWKVASEIEEEYKRSQRERAEASSVEFLAKVESLSRQREAVENEKKRLRENKKGECECVGSDGRRKSTYKSESEARRQATTVLARQRLQLRAYSCPSGVGWHLTKECRCPDHDGFLYPTLSAATDQAELILWNQGIAHRVFRCEMDLGWHLTTGQAQGLRK